MTARFSGKAALITGGGSGIGQGCAIRLAAEGASVAIVDINPHSGEETLSRLRSAGSRAIFVEADIKREANCAFAVQQCTRQYGRLDILVNAAGIYPRATLEETKEDFWDHVLSTNLKGPFFLCKHAVPMMRMAGGGSIVNVGSVHGLGGAGKLAAYSASKGGLLTLTKNLAISLLKDKIRVNYLIPGWVLSQTELRTQHEEGHDEEWLRARAATLGMGRFQTPEDTANAVVFLACDEGVMITGCVLNIDAGYSVRCIGTEPE